jgi:hypothetical protein
MTFAFFQIRGKKCGVVPLEEKDTIFLGNIDKNWTKDEVRFTNQLEVDC